VNEHLSSTSASDFLVRWSPWLLVLAGLAVYANSLTTPFVFDDAKDIVRDRSIEHLWPPGQWMTHTQRPIVKLSLAVNYALGGRHVFGYHLLNLTVHLLAGLVLFGLIRRLAVAYQRGHVAAEDDPRRQQRATYLAFAVALLWLVHPLATESVTYVIQRAESMAGLFYLLTLYAVVRSIEGKHPLAWGVAAVVASVLGMGSKPTVVSVPLVAVSIDQTFYAGSFVVAIRRRWWLYTGLVGTWGVLLSVVSIGSLWHGTGTIGFGAQGIHTVTWYQYAWTQPEVLLHYLRLVIWPHPLCFDYGWPAASHFSHVAIPMLVMGLLLAGTCFAMMRGAWFGVAGAAFFLVLAPTSTIVPISDLAVEHRMYLPLAAVLVILVALAGRVLTALGDDDENRLATSLLVAVALVLGSLTALRNHDYRSPLALWQSVVHTAPRNYRGHNNLAHEYFERNAMDQAIAHYRIALKLQPNVAEGHANLGRGLAARATERVTEARRTRDGVKMAKARQLASQEIREAIAQYRKAIELKPDYAEAYGDLGMALATIKKYDEAIVLYRKALGMNPDNAVTHGNLGAALASRGDLQAGIDELRKAVALNPDSIDAHRNLAIAYKMAGRTTEARRHERRVRQLVRKARGL